MGSGGMHCGFNCSLTATRPEGVVLRRRHQFQDRQAAWRQVLCRLIDAQKVPPMTPSSGQLSMVVRTDYPAGDIRVSPDKRSLIVNRDGWTYTYTPSKAL